MAEKQKRQIKHTMRKKLSVICLALTMTGVALSQQAPAAQTAGQPDTRIAVWKPHFENDNELFPSVVLAMSGRKFPSRPESRMLGDPVGMAGVLIRPSVANANAHVVIQIEGFSATSEIDVTLPAAGQVYNVMPTMRYDFQRLAALDQS